MAGYFEGDYKPIVKGVAESTVTSRTEQRHAPHIGPVYTDGTAPSFGSYSNVNNPKAGRNRLKTLKSLTREKIKPHKKIKAKDRKEHKSKLVVSNAVDSEIDGGGVSGSVSETSREYYTEYDDGQGGTTDSLTLTSSDGLMTFKYQELKSITFTGGFTLNFTQYATVPEE